MHVHSTFTVAPPNRNDIYCGPSCYPCARQKRKKWCTGVYCALCFVGTVLSKIPRKEVDMLQSVRDLLCYFCAAYTRNYNFETTWQNYKCCDCTYNRSPRVSLTRQSRQR